MTVQMIKSKFVIEASMRMAAGELAYNGSGMSVERAVAKAEDLFDELAKQRYIVDSMAKAVETE